jgi:hypothetical protein
MLRSPARSYPRSRIQAGSPVRAAAGLRRRLPGRSLPGGRSSPRRPRPFRDRHAARRSAASRRRRTGSRSRGVCRDRGRIHQRKCLRREEDQRLAGRLTKALPKAFEERLVAVHDDVCATETECCWPKGAGAGDGIRTRDIQLGRLALHQLSYSRPTTSSDRRRKVRARWQFAQTISHFLTSAKIRAVPARPIMRVTVLTLAAGSR